MTIFLEDDHGIGLITKIQFYKQPSHTPAHPPISYYYIHYTTLIKVYKKLFLANTMVFKKMDILRK
jgi:hypothetical protein